MRILWIVNLLLPEIAEYLGKKTGTSGTWMIDWSEQLSKCDDMDLAIASLGADKFEKISLNNKTYYLIPANSKSMMFYDKSLTEFWEKIIDDFKPDLIHIHGTEYSHGLSCMRKFPDIKYLVSVQGILSAIKDVDCTGLSKFDLLKYRTLREWFHFNGMLEMHLLHKKNSKYEREILKRANYANCVNTWDESYTKMINPDITVFRLDYNLRDEYYKSPKWNVNTCKKHTIFTNPGGTVPLKGLIKVLQAMVLLRNKYPDILVKIPGVLGKGNIQITNGYSKYIHKFIKENGLEENIEFLGNCSAQEMIDNALNANVCIVPSAIEGTSLVLRENMFLGCPCISSYRGGMSDYIESGVDGFTFDFLDYPVLASYIDKIFSDDELAVKIGKSASEKAEHSHNREKNISLYLDICKSIFADKE